MGVAPNFPPRDDHQVNIMVDGQHLSSREGPGFAFWISTLHYVGITFTCLELDAASHDIIGSGGVHSEVQSKLNLIGLRDRPRNTCADGLRGEWAHLASPCTMTK